MCRVIGEGYGLPGGAYEAMFRQFVGLFAQCVGLKIQRLQRFEGTRHQSLGPLRASLSTDNIIGRALAVRHRHESNERSFMLASVVFRVKVFGVRCDGISVERLVYIKKVSQSTS